MGIFKPKTKDTGKASYPTTGSYPSQNQATYVPQQQMQPQAYTYGQQPLQQQPHPGMAPPPAYSANPTQNQNNDQSKNINPMTGLPANHQQQPMAAPQYTNMAQPGQPMPQYGQPMDPAQVVSMSSNSQQPIYAQPNPAYLQQQYNVQMQQIPAPQAQFDSGARFSNQTPARIPPPPPGVMANQAQIAASQGQSSAVSKKKSSFWSGGSGGGVSVMGGGLF